MKQFVLKSFTFLLPIILLFSFTKIFFIKNKGDLLRLGYVLNFEVDKYDEKFKEQYMMVNHYKNISNINLNSHNKFKVLTIGDSFSEQSNFGYKNHLAQNEGVSLVHFDKRLNDNPFETIWGVLNGDLLENLEIDYIVLQSIEREMVTRGVEIKKNRLIFKDTLKKRIKEFKESSIKKASKNNLFSKTTIKFPLTNLLYLFDDNAFTSKVYKVKTTKNLFSINKKELLFYNSDKNRAEYNSNIESIKILNDELNILSNALGKRGIKLIVLPSPDKYDFYYRFISNKSSYPKPLFFEHLRKMKKSYLYIDSKQVLDKVIDHKKDLYFYDDSHWSPLSAKIIATEIMQVINKADYQK